MLLVCIHKLTDYLQNIIPICQIGFEVSKADLQCSMAERNVWFGMMRECGRLSFVTGDTLCFSSHAFIARCSYVKPSPAMYGSSITSCIVLSISYLIIKLLYTRPLQEIF